MGKYLARKKTDDHVHGCGFHWRVLTGFLVGSSCEGLNCGRGSVCVCGWQTDCVKWVIMHGVGSCVTDRADGGG